MATAWSSKGQPVRPRKASCEDKDLAIGRALERPGVGSDRAAGARSFRIEAYHGKRTNIIARFVPCKDLVYRVSCGYLLRVHGLPLAVAAGEHVREESFSRCARAGLDYHAVHDAYIAVDAHVQILEMLSRALLGGRVLSPGSSTVHPW